MEIITRKLPLPITPGPVNELYLDSINLDAEAKRIVALSNGLPAYRKSILSQDVLDVLSERHKLKLRLVVGDGINISAKDDKGTLYYLIGSWADSRYICRGLVKRRKGVQRAFFFCNGQADKGTIQIEHYGEQLQICYPEIKAITDRLYYMPRT